LRRTFVATKLGNDCDLTFLDNKKSTPQPQRYSGTNNDAQANTGLAGGGATHTLLRRTRSIVIPATLVAAKQTAQTLIKITPDLI
jgi:hypothetical protein